MKAKYAKAETNINKICQVLEGHQVQLMKDAATLDKMYELNKTYFKELSMYILAGKRKLKEVREGELAQITAKAQQDCLRTPRKPGIWIPCATVLRKSFMIWSLPA